MRRRDVQYRAAGCSAVQRNAMQCNTMQCDAARCYLVPCTTMLGHAMQCIVRWTGGLAISLQVHQCRQAADGIAACTCKPCGAQSVGPIFCRPSAKPSLAKCFTTCAKFRHKCKTCNELPNCCPNLAKGANKLLKG